ncbi:EcsC family protein [Paenibacillus melissococcoides]|uniref:EcsC family protein n=1 Tax=Paenibacillus melissococcoides TaxID=2912268 RepID=A0ABN8U6D5_9BACL|nr:MULTISPECIES: EcsC family protein [Paenibacillus]GIO78794.1 hypothetical protein J6TS7_24040 [Paenibacillus dendritiformis]CAH8245465.1 EcsC family protein [Paenibacillus melissococcoides]CAH8711024.1 EcsC family protein [Paenibacillus melissococcoides]CAH8711800.1 EcsC family protein [Paenibacillus melissococcoides]
MRNQEQYAELERALREVEKWEREQKDLSFFDKIGRLPFTLLERFTPAGLQRKIAELLDELGAYLQTGGKYLVQKKHVLNKLQAKRAELDPAAAGQRAEPDLALAQSLPLAICDAAAAEVMEVNKKVAFAQGATTGFGGLFTLAVDIPAVLGLALKALQETAICYGFDPDDPRERVFIVKCMQFTTSDVVGKQAILKDVADYDNPERERAGLSEMQGWRETMASFTDSFGWKKLFQTIPILGMVFGSFSNRSLIHDMAETGQYLYRKRAILARLQAVKNQAAPE